MILACVALAIAAACRSYAGADPGADGGDPFHDGGGDALVDGDVPPGSDGGGIDANATFCESLADDKTVIFCTDFDTPKDNLYGWGAQSGAGSATLAEGKSGKGLAFVTEASDGGGLAFIEDKPFAPKTEHVKLDYDVIVRQAALDYATLGDIRLAGPAFGNSWGLGIFSGTHLSRAFSPATLLDATSGWHHVTIVIAATQSITIDGTVVDTSATDITAADQSTLHIGIYDMTAQSGAGNATVGFDNVVLRKIP